MMDDGNLTCTFFHGPDGRGSVLTRLELQTMDAIDIRWEMVTGEFEGEYGNGGEERHGNGEYDLDTFRLAVAIGPKLFSAFIFIYRR